MNFYAIGSTIAVRITFRQLTDAFTEQFAPYTPTTPTFLVRPPSGIVRIYTYPASEKIAHPNDDVGHYVATFVPDAVGLWRWEWFDPDPTRPGLVEGAFMVVPAAF